MDTRYASGSLRRRRNAGQWECSLSHTDPVTGEVVRTYHTLVAKTQRQAERARDALIVELGLLGGAPSSSVSLRDFMASFMRHKEDSGTIEPSTARGYRAGTRIICRHPGNVRLAEPPTPDVSGCATWAPTATRPRAARRPFASSSRRSSGPWRRTPHPRTPATSASRPGA